MNNRVIIGYNKKYIINVNNCIACKCKLVIVHHRKIKNRAQFSPSSNGQNNVIRVHDNGRLNKTSLQANSI